MDHPNETLVFLLTLENNLAIAAVISAFGFVVYHLVRLKSANTFKLEYDYRAKYQTRIIWYVFLCFLVTITLMVDSLLPFHEEDKYAITLYLAGLITSVLFATIIAYAFYKWLHIYYSSALNKKLRELRYKPRISPKSNKPMKLLSEEEEDVHLSVGMQAEEDVFSIDYDVWVDEETGHVEIEKYEGKYKVEKCPDCDFLTLHDKREEIVDSPSTEKPGRLLKHYHCDNCGYREKRFYRIAKLEPDIIEHY